MAALARVRVRQQQPKKIDRRVCDFCLKGGTLLVGLPVLPILFHVELKDIRKILALSRLFGKMGNDM
jgi:hypothetical protein